MKTGAEFILDQLEANGIEMIFASPIAVMAPFWEAIAKRSPEARPRYYRCRHEVLAVSLASGYYKATGKQAAVFLPSSLGVQNAAMPLRTALHERTPMTVISPDTLSYGENPETDPGPEWPSLLVDFYGPARDGELAVKWAKVARTPNDVAHELRRALYEATAIPRGPTLLEIPFDLLLGEATPLEHPALSSPITVASHEALSSVAELLKRAENPMIITEYHGRTESERSTLIQVAESLGAPVFEFMQPAFRSFPRNHPLYIPGPVNPFLEEVDAILLLGCNAPWHPPRPKLRVGCSIIHLEEDPLRPRAPYWGYATTHTLPGDRGENLRLLAQMIQPPRDDRDRRRERWEKLANERREATRAEAGAAAATSPLTAAQLFSALHRALPESTACVDEIIAPMPQMMDFLYEEKQFDQFRGWMGALGTSLGTALGVKLARGDGPVLCIIGDGAWHYNPVPAALGFAQEYRHPLFIVLCNNRQYVSQTWNVLRYFPEGEAVKNHNFVGNQIEPAPNYIKQVEAYGGLGETVTEASQLDAAIQRALASLDEGKTFLLDALIAP